jgi:hypothetical protein
VDLVSSTTGDNYSDPEIVAGEIANDEVVITVNYYAEEVSVGLIAFDSILIGLNGDPKSAESSIRGLVCDISEVPVEVAANVPQADAIVGGDVCANQVARGLAAQAVSVHLDSRIVVVNQRKTGHLRTQRA